MSIITIDFEASCLPRHGRSYPIEVGIADKHGSRDWLIRPHADWSGWDWTLEAETLHGITRKTLFSKGQSADIVARELRAALRGRRVVADSHLDSCWLETLNAAAGIVPYGKIDHIANILDELGSTAEDIEAAQAKLGHEEFPRHRARHDARWLYALTETLTATAVRIARPFAA